MKPNSFDFANSTTPNIISQSNGNGHLQRFECSINYELNIQDVSKTETIEHSDGSIKYQIKKRKNGNGKSLIEQLNNIRYWKREPVSIPELAQKILQGSAIHAGLFRPNSDHITESNIENFWALILDFDDDEKDDKGKTIKTLSIANTLNTSYGSLANIVYKSPSYTEERQKHRLIFVYPRLLNTDEHKAVLRWAKNEFACDPGALKTIQYFNGSRFNDANAVTIINPTIKINIDLLIQAGQMLEEDDEVAKQCLATKGEKDRKFVSEKSNSILEDINQRITNALHDGDKLEIYNALYGAFYDTNQNHEFTERVVTSADKDVIRKWEGKNPFTNSSVKGGTTGNSFVVSEKDQKLPLVWSVRNTDDLVTNFQTGHKQNGGSIIDYFYKLNITNYGFIGEDKEEFKRLVTDIYRFFEIEPFQFGSNKISLTKSEVLAAKAKINSVWDEVIDGNFYRMRSFHKEIMYFAKFGKLWGFTNPVTMGGHCLTYYLQQIFGDNEKYIYNGDIQRHIIELMKNGKVQLLDDDLPEISDYYVPFLNGAYNLKTQELQPYENIQIYNRGYHNFDYFDVELNDPDIAKINEYWHKWLGDKVLAETWIYWLILNAQQQAYKSGRALGFIGESGAGKSTAGRFLKRVTGKFCIKESDSEKIFADDNRFGFQNFDNITSLVLEEFRGATQRVSMAKFKQIAGSEDEGAQILRIERKNMEPYNITCRIAITSDSEREMSLGQLPAGVLRRYVFYTITEKHKNSELWNEYGQYLINPYLCRKWLMWAMKHDPDAILRKFLSNAKSPTFEKERKEIEISNDVFYDFCEEHLTVCEGEYALIDELYLMYEKWTVDNGIKWKVAKKGRKSFRQFVETALIKYWDWHPMMVENGEKPVNQKCVMVAGVQKTSKAISNVMIKDPDMTIIRKK